MPEPVVSLRQAKIVVLGAGPTGLGAAHRLQELGLHNFTLFERNAYPGGLAASFTTPKGFTWDVGGHVQFSHYKYFDDLMDSLLDNEWLRHERESWVRIKGRFVPYPFQLNIRYLPEREMKDCLRGLIRASKQNGRAPANFEDWIYKSFGEGVARHFMLPYNFKVWAYPPSELSFHWVGDRVAQVDLERIILNILEKRDDVGWGPNSTFRFPKRGGTGEIWRRLAGRLPSERLAFKKCLQHLDTSRKRIHFEDGTTENYDVLISTIPLDVLVKSSDLRELHSTASGLRYSTVHVVGVGLKGAPPEQLRKKCWMYFPENSVPFYRATVFSNYSYNNVPDINQYWSLMLEVSESPCKRVDHDSVADSVVNGLLTARLIGSKNDVVEVWHYPADHGYPTPSLCRDAILETVQSTLEERHIFSRGRFGAWKYEVSNQDHSLMQGVELINRLLEGSEEVTLNRPHVVNRAGR